ncbi:MAG TPA: pentapeptide repeat-containing protein, partial [Candidatus Gracilibacteria bacterium]|nr:pentapeptide repeat-containing protein [Candidatus Gracilibacteria bacterium]
SVTFEGEADFISANFKGDADFISANFKGDSYFSSTIFMKVVEFSFTIFMEEVNFENTSFMEAVDFQDSEFYGRLGIITNAMTKFQGPVDFYQVQFSSYFSLKSANFSNFLSLRNIKFLNLETGRQEIQKNQQLVNILESLQNHEKFEKKNDGKEIISTEFNKIEEEIKKNRGKKIEEKYDKIFEDWEERKKEGEIFQAWLKKSIQGWQDFLKTEIVILERINKKIDEVINLINISEKTPIPFKPIIDLSYCSIQKLIVDFNQEKVRNGEFTAYNKIYWMVHGTNIQDIACDQEEFLEVDLLSQYTDSPQIVKVFSSENDEEENPLLQIWKPELDLSKSNDEHTKNWLQGVYRSELSVMKKLANMLHMFEQEDKIYMRIMDNELLEDELKRCLKIAKPVNIFKNFQAKEFLKNLKLLIFYHCQKIAWKIVFWSPKLLFKYCFGWGIKLINIAISSIFIIGVFSGIFYGLSLKANLGIFKACTNFLDYLGKSIFLSLTSFFGFFNGPEVDFASGLDILVTTESVIGLIWVTVFVAMLSRKFMRM